MITLAEARKVIAAAEKKAEEIKQPLLSTKGADLCCMRNGWSLVGSIDISINKAFNVEGVRHITTPKTWERIRPGDQFYGIHV